MKQLKFESNNKHWFVVDETELPKIDQILIISDNRFIRISQITEEQASEVLPMVFGRFYTYEDGFASEDYKLVLHSLLKSKGVDDTWINPVIFEVVQ